MRMGFDNENEEEILFVARELNNDHTGDLCHYAAMVNL